jgi:hypothetical protein
MAIQSTHAPTPLESDPEQSRGAPPHLTSSSSVSSLIELARRATKLLSESGEHSSFVLESVPCAAPDFFASGSGFASIKL